MAVDFLAPFGEDIQIGPGPDIGLAGEITADFTFVDSQLELIQRIIRRLLTNPGEWIPFPSYGGGLRRWVNEQLSFQNILSIKAVIIQQVMQEPDVAGIPSPVVDLATLPNGLLATIKLFTKELVPVSFSFNPNAPNIFAKAGPFGLIDARTGLIRG